VTDILCYTCIPKEQLRLPAGADVARGDADAVSPSISAATVVSMSGTSAEAATALGLMPTACPARVVLLSVTLRPGTVHNVGGPQHSTHAAETA